jgi:ubiquinone/menaquinone biosynthesis C-methylase UbiE
MNLEELRQTWDEYAETDPWRAILGRPGEGEPLTVEQFFQQGKYEIEEVMQLAKALDLPARKRTALDFGCGAGRLTQALADHFDEVCGVDISPNMLALAESHNRHQPRCRYLLNQSVDLSAFDDGSQDLIYSAITLQHLRPQLAESYLKEFLRVLAPGGLLLFHLPSHRRSPMLARLLPGNLYQDIGRRVWPLVNPGQTQIEMHCIRRRKVIRMIKQNGGRVLEHQHRDSAGSDWVSYRYAVTRID